MVLKKSNGCKMKLIKGTILNPKMDFSVELWRNGALAVENGKIFRCGRFDELIKDFPNTEIIDYKNSIIIPGLIDTHTHLPQFSAMGLGSGELLEWLSKYIFPLEAKFGIDDFARKQSRLFFDRLIKRGTTSAVIYSSSHKSACDIAFETAEEMNFRAFIGKVMMDSNSPESLISSAKQNIDDSLELAKKWHNRAKAQYVLTPRFALSCSLELMKMTGEIARTDGFFVQTHLSENIGELAQVKRNFPNFSSYTELYDSCGILNEKTLLAHCIYLNPEELDLISQRRCIAVHCPSSNRYLSSGIMPTRKYLNRNLKVSLGTDVAGGYSQSMMNEAMEAIECSKLYGTLIEKSEPLSSSEVLCLSTIKAAEHLNISDKVGNFVNGKVADIAVFELPDYSNIENLTDEDIIATAIYNTENRIARAVYIDGELYK